MRSYILSYIYFSPISHRDSTHYTKLQYKAMLTIQKNNKEIQNNNNHMTI